MVGLIILLNISEEEVRPKGRTLKLYLLPLNSNEQHFLLSLCNGIEKRAFYKSMGAIKSPGLMRFLRYSWSLILKLDFRICELRGIRFMKKQSLPYDILTVNSWPSTYGKIEVPSDSKGFKIWPSMIL